MSEPLATGPLEPEPRDPETAALRRDRAGPGGAGPRDQHPGHAPLTLTIPAHLAEERLDKALAEAAAAVPGLSRSTIARLISTGAVTGPGGKKVSQARHKVKPGETYRLVPPPPAPAVPLPEAIGLSVVHEDAHLIVIDKPAGMVVHPAPGAERGTLVNALLHHCAGSLAGIGGTLRPGIVHRIDKDTSGLLVVAKTAAAMEGLARQFAAHDIDRRYLALCRGAPDPSDARLAGLPGVSARDGTIRIQTQIARHPADRIRMAVVAEGGRRAVTRLWVRERYGHPDAPAASLIECRLETGRTHQIRVHAAHLNHALIGDPVYARTALRIRPELDPEAAAALRGFGRQALHAARLGFVHPVTGAAMAFESAPPPDMADLIGLLRRNGPDIR